MAYACLFDLRIIVFYLLGQGIESVGPDFRLNLING